MSETVVDWSVKPWPWNEIGPRARAEFEAIAAEPESKQQQCRKEVMRRRRALGLSQAALGAEAGYSDNTPVSAFETGRIDGDETYRRLKTALDRLEAERRQSR